MATASKIAAHVVSRRLRGCSNAVVVLPGLGGYPDQLGPALERWWSSQGYDVWALDAYNVRNSHSEVVGQATIYDPKTVATVVGRRVQTLLGIYDHVILEGISLGGRAAFDALTWLKNHGDYARDRVSVLLEGAPMDASCVQGAFMRLGSSAIAAVPSSWLARVSAAKMFGMLSDADIESDADRRLIRKNLKRAQQLPMSMFASQLASFVRRAGDLPAANEWAGLANKAVFVWFSGDDSVVRQDASVLKWGEALGARVTPLESFATLDAWRDDINAGGGPLGLVIASGLLGADGLPVRQARHAAFVEQPEINVRAHQEALALLDL